jgi:hypothetical protein
MADIVKVVKIETVGLRELKSELDGVNKSLDAATNPAQMKQLSAEADNLTGKLKVANTELEQVGKKDYSKLTGNLSQIAGGLGAIATGAALAFGGSEDAEEFFKIMSTGASITMAVVGAIQIAGLAMTWLNSTTVQATLAQWGLNGAMSANIIGVIALAVIGLVAAFIMFQDPIIEFISNWENLYTVMLVMLGPIGWIILAYQELFSEEAKLESERESAAAKEKERRLEQGKAFKENLKRIDEEAKAFIAATNETITALELEKETLEAQGKSSDEVAIKILEAEKEKTTAVLEANAEKIQSWIDYYKTEAQLAGVSEEAYVERMKKQGVDLEALQEKANKLLKKNEDAVQRSQNKIDKFKLDKSKNSGDKSSEDKPSKDKPTGKSQEEIDAENLQALLDANAIANIKRKNDTILEMEKLENTYYDSQLDKQTLEENAVIDKYSGLIAAAEQYGLDATLLKEQQAEKEQEITDRYAQEKLDKDKELKDKQDALDKASAEKKIDLEREVNDAKLNMLSDSFGVISSVTDLFGQKDEKDKKRAFNVNKVVGLAQAAIQTYQSAQGAYLSQMSIPTPDAPVRGAIAAGIATAAGLANMAKIASTKLGSSGSGSSPLASAAMPTSSLGGIESGRTGPNINFNQNGDGTGNNIGGGNKNMVINTNVSISESEITNTQKTVAKYSELSTL